MYSQNDYRYYLEYRLMTSGNFLAHHGVKGMHWGVRKERSSGLSRGQRKTIKNKAKNYQKQLNDLDNVLGASVAGYHSESRRRNIHDNNVKRKEFKGKDSSKSKLKRDKASNRAAEYANSYNSSMNATNKLIKDLSKDKDLVYSVTPTDMRGNVLFARTKSVKELNKNINQKYGKNGILDADYYQYSTGNRYTVKPATEKRKKKYKYTKHTRSVNTPTHYESR